MSNNTQAIFQQQTISGSETDWSRTAEFARFDPSLGALQSIGIGITADVTGNLSIESLEAKPSTVSASLSVDMTATSSTGTTLAEVMPTAVASDNLATYDGGTDYTGASGTELVLASSGTIQPGWQPASTAVGDFVGTGSVALQIHAGATLHVDGPSNLQIASQSTAGATIELAYDYDPGGQDQSGGSSAGSIDMINPILLPLPLEPPVTTMAQSFVVADSTTGWTDDLAVRQFDPALGTLQAINLSVTGDVANSVAAENEDASAATVAVTQAVALTLALPGSTQNATTSVLTTMNLAGFDGSADLAGASGRIDQGWAQSPATVATVGDAVDLAAFTGQGTIAVPLSSSGTSSLDGPGNLLARLLAQAGGTVTVSYSYVPDISLSDITWSNAVGGSWSDAGNWSSAPNPPVSNDDIAITLPGTYMVAVSAAEAAHSIIIDAPGATVVLDADLAIAGDFILDAGTLEFNGGTLSAGDIEINGGVLIGDAVAIRSAGSIAISSGSIVANEAVLQSNTAISGALGAEATSGSGGAAMLRVLAANLALDDASSPALFGSVGPGAVNVTSDYATFRAGAAGDDVTITGHNDWIFGGSGADTVFGNTDSAWCSAGSGSMVFVGGSSANSTVVGAGGASTLFGGSGGGNSLVAGNGKSLIFGAAGDMIWGGVGTDTVVGSADGMSTVIGGEGTAIVFGGSNGVLVFGGSGSMEFAGGSGSGDTVIGGSGSGQFFGGSGGNNVLVAGNGPTTLFGGGSGDRLFGSGSAGDVISAGAGTETLVASATGNDWLIAGSGNDLIFAGGGHDSIVAGSGDSQFVAGSGSNLFVFADGRAGGHDVIWDFSPGRDHLLLAGYAPDAAAIALGTAATSGNATTISLSDNTRITLEGIGRLTPDSFI